MDTTDINIKVKKEDIPDLIDFYTRLNAEDKRQIEILQARIDDRVRNMAMLKSQTESKSISTAPQLFNRTTKGEVPNVYDLKWSLPRKIAYVIESKGYAMTVGEIADVILGWDSDIATKLSRTNLVTQIAAYGGSLDKQGSKSHSVKRVKIDGGYKYGLSEWFNESGELEEGYMKG